jgi:hypothetical protein
MKKGDFLMFFINMVTLKIRIKRELKITYVKLRSSSKHNLNPELNYLRYINLKKGKWLLSGFSTFLRALSKYQHS